MCYVLGVACEALPFPSSGGGGALGDLILVALAPLVEFLIFALVVLAGLFPSFFGFCFIFVSFSSWFLCCSLVFHLKRFLQ